MNQRTAPSGLIGQPRSILHVDMDAFYASVEVIRNPALKGKPVLVGGSGARGVVASCSYEARAYGIRSAMPSSQATRLCPHAVWVSGDHGLYAEYSERVHECFQKVTPVVEGIALDEAFLDVSGSIRLLGPAEDIAVGLREDIAGATGLVCSVGIASSKLLAKLASECAKPSLPGHPPRRLRPGSERPAEGVVRVVPGAEIEFLHDHPIEALWGVGPATKARLDRYGVRSVGDLAAMPRASVINALGKANGAHLHDLAHAIDDRPVEADRALKSVGHEETFATDRRDSIGLAVDATRMADAVSNRMRDARVVGRTVTIKIKFSDFRLITRSKTIASATGSGVSIADVARTLLAERELAGLIATSGVRLLGVSVSSLRSVDQNRPSPDGIEPDPGAEPNEPAAQLDLFSTQLDLPGAAEPGSPLPRPSGAVDAFQRAVDAVRERFGDDAVAPASLVGERGLRIKRRGDTQWGPSQAE
jgi:DNA polymerase IV